MSDKQGQTVDVNNGYEGIVRYIVGQSAISQSEVENVQDSADRIARAFFEMVMSRDEIVKELTKIFSVRFPTNTKDPQLVMQSGIRTVSLCPHHLLPVEAVVHYGYVSEPGNSVIGLSKFVRIAQVLAKRAVIQEQLTQDLVTVMRDGTLGEFIDETANGPDECFFRIGEPVSPHVGVVVNASHGCMSCRGVMSPSRTHTSLFTGLLSSKSWKDDFYQGIEETNRSS